MAEYVTVREPDPREAVIRNAITVLRAAQPHIALPPKRIELGRAADQLEQLLREKATT